MKPNLLTPKQNNSFLHWGKLTDFRHFLMLAILLFSTQVFASHFRYGLVTATRLSETSTTVTYRLNITQSWRLGSASTLANFSISGGNSGGFNVSMTNVTDPSGGWTNSTGAYTITLNKTATPTTIRYFGCCKISTIVNNRDGYWDQYIVLYTNNPGSSPVSTLPAIINMPIGAAAATYTVPANDPDAGSSLIFGMPSFTGNLAGQTEPSGFSLNSTTGQITLNTIGKTIGQQYNALVTVTDNDGNQVLLDFLINMVGPSTPPAFNYALTPANGSIYNVIAGQNISFPIEATDADAGSSVSMSVSGLTAAITTSNFSAANLPASGNPSHTTFSWTPGIAQVGTTNVLNFIATDNVGVQTTTSVTIRVVAEPAPIFVSPTPLQNSVRQIETGQSFSDTIVAQSSLGSNVSIAFATGIPAGAVLSPAIPTAGANPGMTVLNWVPQPSDFGTKNIRYQATITAFPTIFTTLDYQLIVNTTPAFVSTPVLSVIAGQPYSYNIVVSDPNIPFGDTIEIIGGTLPSWLTLVSTGNGTATLSGIPTLANIGEYEIGLKAEDIYHHGPSQHVHQHFDIIVSSPAIITPSGSPSENNTFCLGSGYTLNANTGTGFTYQWLHNNAPISGATAASYAPIISGSYSVVVTINGFASTSNTIEVTVNTAPTIICPQNMNLFTDATSCSASAVMYTPVISATPVASVTYSYSGATTGAGVGDGSLAAFNLGITTVTITALNECGVATCNFTVTVIDNVPPIAVGKDATIQLDANGSASITAAQINNGSADNCSIASITVSPSTFTCANIGANTVTLTITDMSGNITSTNANVTVIGVIPTCTIASSANTSGTIIGSTTTLAQVNQMFIGYGPQSMTLTCTASGAAPFAYSWTGTGLSSNTVSDPVFTPTAGGNYTFVCTTTNAYGCQTTCTITICVLDIRVAGSPANNPKVYLCHVPPGNPNNPQTLSISINAVPAHLGNHSGDKLGSCSSVCGFSKGGNETTGELITEEVANGHVDLIVYPNPSQHAFQLLVEGESQELIDITIYDISGKIVLDLKGEQAGKTIIIDQLTQTGIYIAEVKQGEFRKCVKLNRIN